MPKVGLEDISPHSINLGCFGALWALGAACHPWLTLVDFFPFAATLSMSTELF